MLSHSRDPTLDPAATLLKSRDFEVSEHMGRHPSARYINMYVLE